MGTITKVKRFLGVTTSVLALAAAVAGCGGDGDGDGGGGGGGAGDEEARVAGLEAEVDAAHGVVRAIADALDLELEAGTRRFRACGESFAYHGVKVDEHLRFGPSPLGAGPAVDAAARVLEEEGWSVERPGNPSIVLGTRGQVQVRVEGGAAVQVGVGNPDCVDTGHDVAREFGEREREDVTWEDDPAGP